MCGRATMGTIPSNFRGNISSTTLRCSAIYNAHCCVRPTHTAVYLPRHPRTHSHTQPPANTLLGITKSPAGTKCLSPGIQQGPRFLSSHCSFPPMAPAWAPSQHSRSGHHVICPAACGGGHVRQVAAHAAAAAAHLHHAQRTRHSSILHLCSSSSRTAQQQGRAEQGDIEARSDSAGAQQS